VPVVLVEPVHHPVGDGVRLARGEVLDRAVAADAVDRLEVVLVTELHLGPGRDDGLVQGEAEAILAQEQAAADPAGPLDLAVRAHDVLDSNDLHLHPP